MGEIDAIALQCQHPESTHKREVEGVECHHWRSGEGGDASVERGERAAWGDDAAVAQTSVHGRSRTIHTCVLALVVRQGDVLELAVDDRGRLHKFAALQATRIDAQNEANNTQRRPQCIPRDACCDIC